MTQTKKHFNKKMAKNNIKKIYEVNDVFGVIGYSLVFLGGISQFSNLEVQVIPVDSIMDVFTGLVTTDATGNLVALVLGVGAVLVEKYIKFGRIM